MIQLSVIIPTRNRPELLSCALAALAAQSESRPCFEVLVVDNAPSAETAALVALFQKAVGNLSYITESSPGLHNARHRGMHAATGEILAFIDDDVEVAEGWINFCLRLSAIRTWFLLGETTCRHLPCRPRHGWNVGGTSRCTRDERLVI